MGEEQLACPLTKGERILVALDGSKYGEKALDQAISMAKICNSMLFAVSVVEGYPTSLDSGLVIKEKIEKDTREYLERIERKVAKENISFETIVHVGGQPHEFIVKEAKKRKIDLIVMGTHGRTGLKRIILGSVAQKVIGYAPCSVLVVPAFPG